MDYLSLKVKQTNRIHMLPSICSEFEIVCFVVIG